MGALPRPCVRVNSSKTSRSNEPIRRRTLTINRSRLPTSSWTASWMARSFFWHVRGRGQILGLWHAQLANALIDLDEFGADLLEAAEAGHLAFGLVDLGGLGDICLTVLPACL